MCRGVNCCINAIHWFVSHSDLVGEEKRVNSILHCVFLSRLVVETLEILALAKQKVSFSEIPTRNLREGILELR